MVSKRWFMGHIGGYHGAHRRFKGRGGMVWFMGHIGGSFRVAHRVVHRWFI